VTEGFRAGRREWGVGFHVGTCSLPASAINLASRAKQSLRDPIQSKSQLIKTLLFARFNLRASVEGGNGSTGDICLPLEALPCYATVNMHRRIARREANVL
jgi:hypothetical protein